MSTELVWLLSCGHVRLAGALADGADPWCPRCQVHQAIREVGGGYSVKCAQCRYGKRHGTALYAAQRDADKHARKQPLHTVAVMFAGRTVELRRPKTIMVELPFSDDAPPF